MDIFELDYWCKEHGCCFEISSLDEGVRITIIFVKNNRLRVVNDVCENEQQVRRLKQYVENLLKDGRTKRDEQMEHKMQNISTICAKCKHFICQWNEFPCNDCSHCASYYTIDRFEEL